MESEDTRMEQEDVAHRRQMVMEGSPSGRACRVVLGKEEVFLHPYGSARTERKGIFL